MPVIANAYLQHEKCRVRPEDSRRIKGTVSLRVFYDERKHAVNRATIDSIPVPRPKPTHRKPQGRCLDKGYDYDEVRDLAVEFGHTAHIRARGEEARRIKRSLRFKARRWVVERTYSWMNRFRRILTRWEKKAENYVGLLHLVFASITFRAAGLLG